MSNAAEENRKETATPSTARDEANEAADSGNEDGGEFKITVRKLEMPVRPRGVLAE